MNFSYDNFLRQPTESDKCIKIFDNDGNLIYTINPFQISSTMVKNNILMINLRKGKVISISFSSTNESKLALDNLQSVIDILLEKDPIFIDKQIKNYIDGDD
jgi:phosphotransferase system HPr-like phosphotransfer protein